MVMEPDVVEKVLEDHGKMLNKHESLIESLRETTTKLLISQAEVNIKLANIEAGNSDIKRELSESKLIYKDMLRQSQSNNELLNKLIDKDINKDNIQLEEKISKYTNLKDLVKQFVITGGGLLTALWVGDKVIK